jgi:hypothetical protein
MLSYILGFWLDWSQLSLAGAVILFTTTYA